MKTLLIATDFSDNAKHAAEYGYGIATQLRANLLLLNAFMVPAEMPEGGLVTWPLYDYDDLVKNAADGLAELETELRKGGQSQIFKPAVKCMSEVGEASTVINDIVDKEKVRLTIMGTHGTSGISQFILGNHSKRMINATTGPLLLVPSPAPLTPVKKVAFATDFTHPDKDLKIIYELIDLIKPLNAELLITHVQDKKDEGIQFKKWLDNFLGDISNKADYPNIYYRSIKSEKADKGLNWLCKHGQVDILAMVHRKHGFLAQLLTGSHTQKLANQIDIPLLILPEKE
ncbi:universal stress protein [Mucilaginibacter xinganensis]|nr:universal stress protein [Mucilaginibacter xinganensis]